MLNPLTQYFLRERFEHHLNEFGVGVVIAL